MSLETGVSSGQPRPTARLGRRLLVAGIALVVILAGYAVYATLLNRPSGGTPTLVVYTYASLLGGGCGGQVFGTLLKEFESAHAVNVEVLCPSGTLVSTLLSQRNAPVADVVIGLDEVTGPQAEANHLLVPYASPQLAHVNASVVDDLSPDHLLTPYEWGYLALDYNLSFLAETRGAVEHASFEEIASNASWASSLMVENPTVDITGEEFLLWEIAYYSYIAHSDWRGWWQTVDPHVQVAPDWTSAFTAFTTPPNSPLMVVSYSTDPAYAAYYGQGGSFNSTVTWANGTAYGWKTIYGLGIVNGTAHTALDEAFVDWFLSGAVQSQIPTNEWEYPANTTVALPAVFNASLDPSGIMPLNGYLAPATVASSLPGWLDEWQTLANQYG